MILRSLVMSERRNIFARGVTTSLMEAPLQGLNPILFSHSRATNVSMPLHGYHWFAFLSCYQHLAASPLCRLSFKSFHHSSLLTPHSSPLTTHNSQLTTHFSLFTIHCSLLTIHCSLFTAHCSPFTIHYSLPYSAPMAIIL